MASLHLGILFGDPVTPLDAYRVVLVSSYLVPLPFSLSFHCLPWPPPPFISLGLGTDTVLVLLLFVVVCRLCLFLLCFLSWLSFLFGLFGVFGRFLCVFWVVWCGLGFFFASLPCASVRRLAGCTCSSCCLFGFVLLCPLCRLLLSFVMREGVDSGDPSLSTSHRPALSPHCSLCCCAR